MKRTFLIALATLGFAACQGNLEETPTKKQIADALAGGDTVESDVCAVQGWNEDGVCDSWCPDGDTSDCNGDIVCAAFIEDPNGVCGRDPSDPCISQDPDCDIACPAIYEEPDGVCDQDPTDPCDNDPDCVACAEFIETPNGVCERSPNDPCIFQDPDCDDMVCPAIAEEPDGVCNEDPNEPCPTDPDCEHNQ